MQNDLDINTGEDFDMDQVDDMPEFINEIEGVYQCTLNLKREVDEDRGRDNLVFVFKIVEAIEERKDHGINPDDICMIRYGLNLSERDKQEGNKHSFGLKLAKPFLSTLKAALNTSSSLEDIINQSQGVECTATFNTRSSDVKQDDGTVKTYHNPQLRKLIIS